MSAVRVRLVTPDLGLLDAAIDDGAALARALGCVPADSWKVFPDAVRSARDVLADDPASVRWGPRLIVLMAQPSMLVGWGGFKGRPRDGVVEIRYAVAPGQRCRGIARAAVRELVREAFLSADVIAVVARTDAALNPSARVLAKAGFIHEGKVGDDEIGNVWLFRYDRMRGDSQFRRGSSPGPVSQIAPSGRAAADDRCGRDQIGLPSTKTSTRPGQGASIPAMADASSSDGDS